MIWFQAAFDAGAKYGEKWVVLQMGKYITGEVNSTVISHWPTQHEAEGHANKLWKALK